MPPARLPCHARPARTCRRISNACADSGLDQKSCSPNQRSSVARCSSASGEAATCGGGGGGGDAGGASVCSRRQELSWLLVCSVLYPSKGSLAP